MSEYIKQDDALQTMADGTSLCPICGREHEENVITEDWTVVIHGKDVTYPEVFCRCPYVDEDNEYETGAMMRRNFATAMAAYEEAVSDDIR